MAAPCKRCKSERRFLKRWRKSQYSLQEEENITVINQPSCHMVVSNAGLGNSVSREEVNNNFSKYGKVVNISMKPGKSYCFVSMASEDSAVKSFNELNGKLLKSPDEIGTEGIRFYFSYIQSVPENEVVTGDVPSGLLIIDDFVDEIEEQMLLQSIDWTTIDKKMTTSAKSSLKHRRVKHYGYEFLYGVNNVDINCPLDESIPTECSGVIDRMLDGKLIEEKPDQLTVNQYQPGQGIPPHIDTHSAFTDWIVSLSLGSQVVMDFRHPDGRHVPVLLPRRSLAIMTGESRYTWSHGITQRKSDILPLSQLKNIISNSKLTDESSDSMHAIVKASHDKDEHLSEPLVSHVRSDSGTSGSNKNRDHEDKLSRSFRNICVDNNEPSESPNQQDIPFSCDGDKSRVESDIQVKEASGPRTEIECDTRVNERGGLTLVNRGVRTSFTFRKILARPCTCNYPEQCDSQKATVKPSAESDGRTDKPAVPETESEAQRLESRLVHQVYEEIAGHFSETRHSPWPQVVQFLKFLPPGSVILDVGCGNGKYLGASSDNLMVGCDRSENLCRICLSRGFPVFVCDCLAVPVRSASVDVAISIAVIHHLSTKERRLCAVKEMMRLLCVGGQALIYVWALEQELNKKKSTYLKDSSSAKECMATEESSPCETVHSGDDLPPEDSPTNSSIGEEGLHCPAEDRKTSVDNKQKVLSIHKNRTAFQSQDLMVPWHLRDKTQKKKTNKADKVDAEIGEGKKQSVFHRYYHVFRHGELEELCLEVPGVQIVKSYYDQGNWCVILKKKGDES